MKIAAVFLFLAAQMEGFKMKTKRFLSLIIVMSMVMSILGVSVHGEENAEISIMHNIAQKYTGEAILSDENIHWFLADIEEYNKLYPESSFVMSEAQKQACLDKVIEFADNATSSSDLSRSIIALRSLGYDAKKVTTKDLEEIDVVAKLTALVDAEAAASEAAALESVDVLNPYRLSYVIIALQQGEDYASEEQMDWLIEQAISQKASWQDTMWGPDGAAPMVLALRPYYETNDDIKALLDETVEIIKNCQTDTGLMSDSVCSTGLSMVALATMGIECEEVIKNEKNLIDGLMTYKTQELDGFNQWGYSFATEQGFRGLLAWQLSKQGKRIYDFSSYPMNEAKATVDLPQPLPEPTPEPTPDDSIETVSIKVKVMIHNEDECRNSYTYKYNSGEYTTLVNQTIIAETGVSVFDVLVEALTLNGIDYVEGNNGYIVSINEIDEFAHGKKSGWMFMVNGEHINTGSTATLLAEDSTVIWFYTDNYAMEKGSESFSTTLGNKTPIDKKEEKEEVKEENVVKEEIIEPEKPEFNENTYQDVKKDDWYYEAVKYAYKNNLMQGTENGFEPEEKMTRAMLVTVLYRLESPIQKSQASGFADIEEGAWYEESVLWAAENKIVTGVSETEFAPNQELSREQMAVILYRYANLKGINTEAISNLDEYSDREEISDWAIEALGWANSFELINGIGDNELSPKASATRAQIATILMRFCEMISDYKGQNV